MPSLLPTPALFWRAAVAVPEERERANKQKSCREFSLIPLYLSLLNNSLHQPVLCLWRQQINKELCNLLNVPFLLVLSSTVQHTSSISEQDPSNYLVWIEMVGFFLVATAVRLFLLQWWIALASRRCLLKSTE